MKLQTIITEELKDTWLPSFFQTSPLFWPVIPAFTSLREITGAANNLQWPALIHCNQLLANNIINDNQKNIRFVEQSLHCQTFEEEYEPRIYLSGQVQTRLENWHDFFQVLVWKTFPKTKSLLNKIHYDAAVVRRESNMNQRGPQENFVTLFDECGTVVLATEKRMLDLIRDFNWKTLFIEHKEDFGKTIDCCVFGHAMYEKALNPYIGMTSHCLLLQVDDAYFQLSTKNKTSYIDNIMVNHIKQMNSLNTINTRCLSPLPILGVPGWHKNQTASFYENEKYFRSGRKKDKT